jgi:hypothetical protein
MNLTVVIFANSVVQSTFSDGRPADEYSGKIEKLIDLYDVSGIKKYTVSKEKRIDKRKGFMKNFFDST